MGQTAVAESAGGPASQTKPADAVCWTAHHHSVTVELQNSEAWKILCVVFLYRQTKPAVGEV